MLRDALLFLFLLGLVVAVLVIGIGRARDAGEVTNIARVLAGGAPVGVSDSSSCEYDRD